MLNKLAELLQSGAQGANNSVSEIVSGPIDLIGTGLRRIGVPVPENAIGSSRWMAEHGLRMEPKNKLAGMIGEGLGGALPFVIANKAYPVGKYVSSEK